MPNEISNSSCFTLEAHRSSSKRNEANIARMNSFPFFIFRYDVNFFFILYSSPPLWLSNWEKKREELSEYISKHINMILSHLKISSVANTVLKRAFNADICEGQRRGMEARYYAYMQICMCEKNASCIFTVHCLPTPIPFVASVHPVRFLH